MAEITIPIKLEPETIQQIIAEYLTERLGIEVKSNDMDWDTEYDGLNEEAYFTGFRVNLRLNTERRIQWKDITT